MPHGILRGSKSSSSYNGNNSNRNSNSDSNEGADSYHAAAHQQNSDMTILYSLINNQSWDEAISRCNSHPREASTWHNSHLLPIHRACELNPPSGGTASKLIRVLLKAFPDGASSADDNGRLPLHFACWKRANVEVVEALLVGYKESAQARDVHGRLALHVACEFGASEEVVKLLVRSFPASIYVADLFQRTPLKITSSTKYSHKEQIMNILQGRRTSLFANLEAPLLGSGSASLTNTPEGSTDEGDNRSRARSASSGGTTSHSSNANVRQRSRSRDSLTQTRSVSFAPLHTLYNLISQKNWEDATICAFRDPSEAAQYYTENNLNMLPIHKACELQPTKGIVRVLIEAYKDGLNQRDQEGRLPLHSACWKCASEDVILFMVKANRETAKVKDFHGRLPLHLACEYGATEQSILTLIKAYPDGVKALDEQQRTPIEIVAENQFYNKDELIAILSAAESSGRHGSHHSNGNGAVGGLREYLNDFMVTPSISRCNSRASSRGSYSTRGDWTSRRSDNPLRSVRSGLSTGTNGTNKTDNISLYNLVSRKQWDLAELRCQMRGEEASIWSEKWRDDGSLSWRLLPIHRACELQPTVQFIQCLIRAYPSGLDSKDHSDRVPLHSACRKLASANVIATLVASRPRTATYQDKKGRLPLHIACEYGASSEIIQHLVAAFPKGADETDMKGNSPRSLVNTSKFKHKASMLNALDSRKTLDNHFSAFYSDDTEDASMADQFCVGMTERSAILRNLSVSFANSEVDDDNQGEKDDEVPHMGIQLKPTLEYASKPSYNSSSSSKPTSQTDPSIWIGNCNTTSSLSTDFDEGEERTILCSLVSSMKWDEAIQRCLAHPEEAAMWWCKRDRAGHALWQLLPIHKACELAPTVEIVNSLIHAYPECVMSSDQSGRLPIHLACCRGASASVISMLLEHGGEASLTVKDAQGRLPLHVACVHGAAEQVILMLMQAYPEGVEVEDNNGRTPVKIIQQSTHRHKRQIMYLLNKQTKRSSERSLSPGRSVGSMSISKKSINSVDRLSTCSVTSSSKNSAVKSSNSTVGSLIPTMELNLSLELKDSQSTELTATDATDSTASFESSRQPKLYTLVEKRRWELVQAKLSKYRNEARIWYVKSDHGVQQLRELTLHRACQLQAPEQVLRSLICVYPQGARSKTLEGKLPLHLVCEYGSTPNAVDVLMKAYPDGVHQKDNSGMLPIHYACDKGYSVDVIKMLIRKFPASLDAEDNYHRSPKSIMNARYFAATGVKP